MKAEIKDGRFCIDFEKKHVDCANDWLIVYAELQRQREEKLVEEKEKKKIN